MAIVSTTVGTACDDNAAIDPGLGTSVVALVVAAAGVPIARAALAPLGRAAVLLGPAAGLLLLTWGTWLLGRSGLAAPGGAGPVLAFAALALLAIVTRLRLGAAPAGSGRLLAIGAGLGLGAYVVFLLVRAYAPALTTGEQPMDLAILSALQRAPELPPQDAWLAGEPLNYYYGGQLALAAVGTLAGASGPSFFNACGALVPALCAVSAFGVGVALHDAAAGAGRARPRFAIPAGLTAAGLGVLAGNLHGGLIWLRDPTAPRDYPWREAAAVSREPATNEFPAFAFVHGEVHAHMLATPIGLLVAAGAVRVALHGPGRATGLLLALAVGGLYVVNGWDLPTALALVAGGTLLWATRHRGQARRALGWAALVAGGAALLWLPFAFDLTSGASGIGLTPEPTGLPGLARYAVLMFGLPLVLLAGRLLRVPARAVRWPLLVVVAAVVVVAALAGHGSTAVVALAAGALAVAALDRSRDDALRVVLGLAALGVALAGASEVAYVRDNYDGGTAYRMNTTFKFGYQAWWVLALAAAASVWRTDGRPAGRRGAGWQLVAGATAAVALVFTLAAPVARTGGFEDGPSLDGLAWMEAVRPGDAAAIRWLDRREGTPGILEAVGDDYGPSARISSYTGLPALSGWAGHELSWGRALGFERKALADDVYRSSDAAASLRTLRRFGIVYVVVGQLERDRYPATGLRKFARIGRVAFAAGGTTVYRLRAG